MNGVAEQYTGWNGVEAHGLPLPRVFIVVDEQTREPIGNVATIAMVSGRTAGVGTHLQMVRRDGEAFSIDAVAAPLHDARGMRSSAWS